MLDGTDKMLIRYIKRCHVLISLSSAETPQPEVSPEPFLLPAISLHLLGLLLTSWSVQTVRHNIMSFIHAFNCFLEVSHRFFVTGKLGTNSHALLIISRFWWS